MSHRDFALVWSILYGQEDISSVLLEAAGSHSLDVSVYRNDPERLCKAIAYHVLNLKVIYDLQRNYLQSSTCKSKPPFSLLRREVLFSSILHLLDVITVGLSLANGSPSPSYGALYAETLLSALRALSLRDGSVTEDEHRLLSRRFEETFKKAHLRDLDTFTIDVVCRRMISALSPGVGTTELSTPACGEAKLPDFFGEPFVLELSSERTTGAIRRALNTPPTASGWLHGVLLLYDIVWSTTAALIRLCMITQERKRRVQWSLSDEASRLNDLHSLLAARFQVHDLIFSTPGPENFSEDERRTNEQLKALLLSGLHLKCVLDQCDCLGKDLAPVEVLRSQHIGKQALTEMSISASTYKCLPDDDIALRELASSLRERMLRTGQDRYEIGEEAVDTCIPIMNPRPRVDTHQEFVLRLSRRKEILRKPTPSTAFPNDLDVPKTLPGIRTQNLRPADSEEKPIVSPDLILEQNVVHPSRAEENSTRHVTTPEQASDQPQLQLSQNIERVPAAHEESPPLAIEPENMAPHIAKDTVPQAYISSTMKQDPIPIVAGDYAASELPTPSISPNQPQLAQTPLYELSTPWIGSTKSEVQPARASASAPELENHLPSATGRSLTAGKQQIDHKFSCEKICVDPGTDVKMNRGRPPHVGSNLLLDLKLLSSGTAEGNSSFVAPSYDEIPRLDKERTNSTASRSPTLSTEGTTSCPKTPQVDRENYPELAPLQCKQTSQPARRRIDVVDADNFPEPLRTLQSRGTASFSGESEPNAFVLGDANSKPKKWGALFKSSRTATAASIPLAAFCASGGGLILWNELGAGCYDLHNVESIQFRRINARDVRLAAGGAARFAVVTKTSTGYGLEVFEGACDAPIRDWRLDSLPGALAVSRNDYYIALKFPRHVSIYEIATGATFYHELPAQAGRSGRGNHLVTFAADSLSFMASTRHEPEKVITYWSECTNSSNAKSVESIAPFGLVGDDGLSSLLCSRTPIRSAYLTTFTEKGPPALLSCSHPRPSSRLLRDNNGVVGARIHCAALCPSGSNLVLMNQRNNIFWASDCFGENPDVRQIGSVKRPTSVKREVEIGMPNSDEMYVFWIDKGKGNLVMMGKGGGKTKPVELMVDMKLLVA